MPKIPKTLLPIFFLLITHTVADDDLIEMSASGEEESTGGSEVEGSGQEGSGEEVASNSTRIQIFPPNVTKLLTPPDAMSLEDFAIRLPADVKQQTNLTEVILDFQPLKFTGQSVDELNGNYGRAFDALLSVAPNLRVVHPTGGHFFYPENGTMRDVETEIEFVRNAIATMTRQMTKRNLSLSDDRFDYIKYTLYVVIDDLEFNQTELDRQLKSKFGRRAFCVVLPPHSSVQTATVLYDENELNIKLDILSYVDIDRVLDIGLESGDRLDYKSVIRPLGELDRVELKQKAEDPIVKFFS